MSKYNEIMEHVTVSDEIKNRILENIHNKDTGKSNTVKYPNVKRYMTFAACILLFFAGAVTLKQFNKTPPVEKPVESTSASIDTGGVQLPPFMTEYPNAEALSKATGIRILDLANLPFEPRETVYQSYDSNIAEIVYKSDENAIFYRVSKGNEDNSGDYNEYSHIEKKQINATEVTFKGNGKLIYCVLFEKDGYSYSITSENGLTKEQTEKLL